MRATLGRAAMVVVTSIVAGLSLSACGGSAVTGAAKAAPLIATTTIDVPSTTTTSPPSSTTTTTEDTTTTDSQPEDTTSETTSAASEASATGSYPVTISGTVSGRSFRRSATLRIEPTISSVGTTNDVNPVDVCLISGFPAGQPDVGAIWFSSNSGCDPGANAADLDLAFVTVDGSEVTVKPDERIAATGGNNFTSSSSYISACPYFPVSGQLQVTVDGSDVRGTIDVNGYGGASCGNSEYQATISG